jgi:hypothetical protein
MESVWQQGLWEQFGAAIRMLRRALEACPDEMWHYRVAPKDPDLFFVGEFWYIGWHTLFNLDLYLSGKEEGFVTPAEMRAGEADPAFVAVLDKSFSKPIRAYSKQDLMWYLEYCYEKCRKAIQGMTETNAAEIGEFWIRIPMFEMHLYNMRHVQEHAAQLSLVLGDKFPDAKMAEALDWVARVTPIEGVT